MHKIRSVKTGPNGKLVLGPFDSFQEVNSVTLCRRGETYEGSLYLAEHHIIFSWTPPAKVGAKSRSRQIWITYPMIARCILRPMPLATRQLSSIRLQCRDFTFVAFQLTDDASAREIFDHIRTLSCQTGSLDRLYAFSYKPPPDEQKIDGWHIYDARREFKRMGIGPKEADRGWRISDINHDYVVRDEA